MVLITNEAEAGSGHVDSEYHHPWRCSHCGAVVGYNHNAALVIAGQRVESSRPLKVECPGCRRMVRWWPKLIGQ